MAWMGLQWALEHKALEASSGLDGVAVGVGA